METEKERRLKDAINKASRDMSNMRFQTLSRMTNTEYYKYRAKQLEYRIEILRTRCMPEALQMFDKGMYGCLKIVPVNGRKEQ